MNGPAGKLLRVDAGVQEVEPYAVVGGQPLERPLILREDPHVVVHVLLELNRRRELRERERLAAFDPGRLAGGRVAQGQRDRVVRLLRAEPPLVHQREPDLDGVRAGDVRRRRAVVRLIAAVGAVACRSPRSSGYPAGASVSVTWNCVNGDPGARIAVKVLRRQRRAGLEQQLVGDRRAPAALHDVLRDVLVLGAGADRRRQRRHEAVAEEGVLRVVVQVDLVLGPELASSDARPPPSATPGTGSARSCRRRWRSGCSCNTGTR